MAKQNKPPEYPSETGRFLSGHWSPLINYKFNYL